MDEQQQLVNQLETASIQYNIIRREVETNQKIYEGILERLKQTSVTACDGVRRLPCARAGDAAELRGGQPKVKWNLPAGDPPRPGPRRVPWTGSGEVATSLPAHDIAIFSATALSGEPINGCAR